VIYLVHITEDLDLPACRLFPDLNPNFSCTDICTRPEQFWRYGNRYL